MHLDRILIDILDWIRRLIHRKEIKKKPYEVLWIKRSPTNDVLLLIDRDTPRAIRTYIFKPNRVNTPHDQVRDLHIYLDTLSFAEEAKVTAIPRPLRPTHKITILWASPWLIDDSYPVFDIIHEGYYDLQGRSPHPHQMAIAQIDLIASMLLHNPLEQMDWEQTCIDSEKAVRRNS